MIGTRFKTKQELADQVGMSLSAFVRGVEKGTLSIDNLLHLAEVVEEPASAVLRRADKSSTADLIEKLYGTGQKALKPSQLTLLDVWKDLEIDDKKAVLYLMKKMQALTLQLRHDDEPPRRRGA